MTNRMELDMGVLKQLFKYQNEGTAKKRLVKKIFFLTGVFFAVQISLSVAHGASDPRFFGRYCGEDSYTNCYRVNVKLFGWTVYSRRQCDTYQVTNVDAHLYYDETAGGHGGIHGSGRGDFRSRTIHFSIAGTVVARGRAVGLIRVPGLETYEGTASLSDNGEALTLSAYGGSLTFRKDNCENRAPSVEIVGPALDTFPWAWPISFEGSVTDHEDSTFSRNRLVWRSNRSGVIGLGTRVRTNFLAPGAHSITFSATDSGGRTTTRTKNINIANNRPNRPVILEPRYSATFYEGDVIAFRGRATDREDGFLRDDSLVWSSNLVSERIGTGNLFTRTLPVGNHTISLTAEDREGISSSISIPLTVSATPAGNSPPTVSITSPEHQAGIGDASDDCFIFVAEAHDLQDGRLTGSALVWEDRQDGVGTSRHLGSGERVEACGFSAGAHDTWHTISVTATDTEGAWSAASIRIYVIPGGLI